MYVISLIKVLEVERLGFRLLENSIATLLLFVYCVHIACCCIRLLVYSLFSLILVVVGLLGTSFMYLLAWLLLIVLIINDITLLSINIHR